MPENTPDHLLLPPLSTFIPVRVKEPPAGRAVNKEPPILANHWAEKFFDLSVTFPSGLGYAEPTPTV